jgi:hypothetical protein
VHHADGRLQALLPLVFHPLTMVRRAMATFLAPILFLPPCQLADPSLPHAASEYGSAPADAPSSAPLALYATFLSSHYLPVASRAIELPAASPGPSSKDSAAAGLLGPEGQDKIHMVGLLLGLVKLVALAEQRAQGSSEAEHQISTLACMQNLLKNVPGELTCMPLRIVLAAFRDR